MMSTPHTSLLFRNLGYLESTRHHCLKDTFRVVLLRCSADFLDVLLTIALERLLCLVRIVEIDPPICLTKALGVVVQLADQPFTDGLKDVVVLWAVVAEVGLEHWDLPRVSQ